MKLLRTGLLVLAAGALLLAAAHFDAAGSRPEQATAGISFSLRILGQELLGISFQDSRTTTLSWINTHEEK